MSGNTDIYQDIEHLLRISTEKQFSAMIQAPRGFCSVLFGFFYDVSKVVFPLPTKMSDHRVLGLTEQPVIKRQRSAVASCRGLVAGTGPTHRESMW